MMFAIVVNGCRCSSQQPNKATAVGKNIVVTGGRSTYTLDLIRMLSKAGHFVHSVESSFVYPFPLSRFSSHVHCHHFIDVFPNVNPRLYAKKLGKYCADNSISLIIPTCEDAMWVSKYKSIICQEFQECRKNVSGTMDNELTVFVGDFEIMKQVHDKFTFNHMIQDMMSVNGADQEWSAPHSVVLHTRNDLTKYLNDMNANVDGNEQLDIVLKPAFSRFAVEVLIRPSLKSVLDTFDMNTQDSESSESELSGGPWVGQQYIDGELLCSYSIVHNGQVAAHVVYVGGVYTNSGRVDGGSVYFENANDPNDVRHFVQQFVSSTTFTGQISFDFIRCHKTLKLYPIECNPRSTSGIHLFRSVNPAQFASCFFDADPQMVLSPIGKNQQIAAAMVLLLAFIMPIKSFQDIRSWFSKFLIARDIIYDPTDVVPVITQFLSILDPIYKVLKYGIAFTRAFTHDIEYNAENATR